MLLAAVAALGLCVGTASSAKAQYWQQSYYYPNTGYVYSYATPGVYSYSPYYSGNVTPYYYPYVSGYTPGVQYYNWDWYNPYTSQYRTWRWMRRW